LAQRKVARESGVARPQLQNTSDNYSWKTDLARREIRESIQAKEKLGIESTEDIIAVGEMMVLALRDGRKVVFFGNGGSAADAQHLAAEFVGKFGRIRRPLRAIALTTNTSVLSAVGNDFGFEEIFSRQVAAHVDEGDIVVGISTSGRSKNVINGISEARRLGAKTVALTGASGGEFAQSCDYHIMVPSTNTQRIQECHILIGHILCGLVEASLTEPVKVHLPSTTAE
jgi:D-sedoheptulose 7-phosphate isomerase